MIDRREGILLARRRRLAAFIAAIEEEELQLKLQDLEKDKEKKKEEEREREREKEDHSFDRDLDDGEDDSGWVIMDTSNQSGFAARAKEREDMRRKEEEQKKKEKKKQGGDKNISDDVDALAFKKIKTPWWEDYTPEEEEIEKHLPAGEKPLWKEVFVAWKIARDRNMLHVRVHFLRSLSNL